MTGPDQAPPEHDVTLGAPAAPRTPGADAGATSPAGRVPPGHQRTHPITPLVTGWRIILGVLAVAFQGASLSALARADDDVPEAEAVEA